MRQFLLAFGGRGLGGTVEHQLPVEIEITVKRRDRAVIDQPEPVGAGFDQKAVMRDQDDRTFIIIDGFHQCEARIDVEMVGRFIENEHMRAFKGRQPHHQTGLFATRQAGNRRIGLGAGKAHTGTAGPDFGLGAIGHPVCDMAEG